MAVIKSDLSAAQRAVEGFDRIDADACVGESAPTAVSNITSTLQGAQLAHDSIPVIRNMVTFAQYEAKKFTTEATLIEQHDKSDASVITHSLLGR
jgi:hypothetical protein